MAEPRTLEESPEILVRPLTQSDLEDIIRIDAAIIGRPRRDYYRLKLAAAIEQSSVHMSLGAELDGMLVGFLFGSLFYGDFGIPEPVATLDALGVRNDFARRGVATAMWEELTSKLRALRVERIRTQVSWNNWELMTFFRKVGFTPGPHICLDRAL